MKGKTMKSPINQAMINVLTTDQKNVLISATIIALKDAGLDLKTAFDLVLGEGAYDRVASEVFVIFNTKREGGK
jgi:hypothetical protein